ncbi:MAG: DotU family type IV/VI secretion system protein [Phycisphaerae bacterium]|nr:DotU family type IV/VI secretion system protein [Phycisphaerae bacterium]
MTEYEERSTIRLTEVCWPLFDFAINFGRQVKFGATPPPDQVRYEALSAIRDAEDLAQRDPMALRAWEDHLKAMMCYFLDYKMLNCEWEGRDFWFDHRFETDVDILNHVEALGGEKFFEACDENQREYELAERRDRRDKFELAEKLNLYFICLRLGFKGQYHDRPQELADYTRRLFTRLPAYSTSRGKEMFPEAYKHNQEVKVDYKLGLSLTLVLVILVVVVGVSLTTFRVAWSRETAGINNAAAEWTGDRVPVLTTDEED